MAAAAPARAADLEAGRRKSEPCKACHGAEGGAATVYVARPFEGLPSECDIVAMRELVPSATAPISVKGTDGKATEWMIEGGTPNTLLRRGFTEDSLQVGTAIKVDGYGAKDGTNKANGRDLTLPDGRKLFMGTSGTGAPTDGADPGDPSKPTGRGRGGR